ncbi:MAG: hypothetical protein QF570_10610 [Myxococcota bacterium]|jgi:hypothetical protein|nr:hypothetical protein [Myxococcota bacterium]
MSIQHRFFAVLTFVAVAVVQASSATAGGVGAYLEYPRGNQTIAYNLGEADFTNTRLGAGIVLDTNVARDELLNVRGTVGYVRTENTVDEEAHGGALDLSVGFGVVRLRDLRLWVAPAARIGVDFYDNDLAEVLGLGFGGGVRLGLNWHVSPQVSIAPSIAYQYMYVRETIDDDFGKDRFNGTEQLITVRLTFLFRDAEDIF